MRLFVVIVSVWWWLATAVVAAPPHAKAKRPSPEVATAQNILKWINGYRSNKEPQKLPETVRAMSALGLFKDLDNSGVYIGFMAGQANPLVGCRTRLGGRMRRHGPWREMLRKIRLQDLALFRCDDRSPSHHLGDGIRPPGQRQFLAADDVGLMTADAALVQHVETGARGQWLLRGEGRAGQHDHEHRKRSHLTSIRTESY